MPRLKLALAILILGASLLVPTPGEANPYCPDGCFSCYAGPDESVPCCKYVGGRLLRCA
jgi:hypothetical protein